MNLEDFTKEFRDNFEESKRLKSDINKSKSILTELIKEVETLEAKRDKIIAEIEINKRQALIDIQTAKNNSDRVFKQEDDRITKANNLLMDNQKSFNDREIQFNRKNGLLGEKEERLIILETRLKKWEIDLNEKNERANRLLEEAKALSNKNTQEFNEIKVQHEKDDATYKDLSHAHAQNKIDREKIRLADIENKNEIARLNDYKKKLEERRKELDVLAGSLTNEQKKIDEQKVNLALDKKNAEDKENTIQSMNKELDFKIAMLATIEKKKK